MIFTRALGFAIRIAILVSSCIVAGVVGHYLDVQGKANSKAGKRFIYTVVVAGISILASIVTMIPTTWALTLIPFDFIMFVLWLRTPENPSDEFRTNTDLYTDRRIRSIDQLYWPHELQPQHCVEPNLGCGFFGAGWVSPEYDCVPGSEADMRTEQCATWKTAIAFIFISAILWLIACIMGAWIVHKERRNTVRVGHSHGHSNGRTSSRRRWGRSRV